MALIHNIQGIVTRTDSAGSNVTNHVRPRVNFLEQADGTPMEPHVMYPTAPAQLPSNLSRLPEELKANFTLAKRITDYVRPRLFSTNFPEKADVIRNNTNEHSHEDMSSRMRAMACCLHRMKEAGKLKQLEVPNDPLSASCARAEVALKYNIGNCREMADVGIYFARASQAPQRVERFQINGGDHEFIVIGRKIGSDPSIPETWGPNAVICDSWSDQIYTASELRVKLHDYCGEQIDWDTGITRPLVLLFNSEQQTLASAAEWSGGFFRRLWDRICL